MRLPRTAPRLIVVGLVLAGAVGAARAGRFDGWVSREPKDSRSRIVDPASIAPAPNTADICLAELRALGGMAAVAAAPPAQAGCDVDNPVRLGGVAANGGVVKLTGEPLLACGFARDVAGFVRDIAEPLARAAAGRRLVGLQVGGGHECRPRNRAAGARLSAHGRGVALDISAFLFEGGERVVVSDGLTGPAGRYVTAVRKAACGYFTTVLGPGADAAHADHLHLDAELRGRSGQSRVCQ